VSNPPAPRSASRERMLETAIDLMRGFGLSGAGINDLVRESGAPKGSVYHFFPGGKLQIAEEALAAYGPRVRELIVEALAGAEAPPEKVRTLFRAFARRLRSADFSRSCMVGTVGLDLDDSLEPLRQRLASTLDGWADAIAAAFDLGSTRRTRAFAGFVLTAIEGAYVRARVERSSTPFTEAGEWLATLLE